MSERLTSLAYEFSESAEIGPLTSRGCLLKGYLAGARQMNKDAAEVANKHWFKHTVVSGVVDSITIAIKKLAE